MMSINNRFSALQMNAKDPFSSKKGRIKTESQKSTTAKLKSDRITSKAAAPSQHVPVEKTKSETVVVSKADVSVKLEESTSKKQPEIVICDISFQKDDRAAHTRSDYRKVLVNTNKRLLERHGAKDVRIDSVEKRQGHGSFNWGDAIESEEIVPEVEKKEEVEVVEKEVVMQVTLEQYHELLKNNKINPLEWKEQMIKESESDLLGSEKHHEFDVREYQYRPQRATRGGRGGSRGRSFPPRAFNDGRGGFKGNPEHNEEHRPNRGGNRSRGRGRGFNRNGAGTSYRGRGSSNSPRDQNKPQDVRIDDKLDFPDIDRFN